MFEETGHPTIRISRVPGAGLGVFAKRSIKGGEDLFEERPLLVIEAFLKEQCIPWAKKCAYLRKKIKGLSLKERKQYYELHDCKQAEGNLKRVKRV